ncbi:MAG TPA: hypothetical protein PLF40_25205, partial [Kofleriaceae bacterium]|nr:hypothetical protein [Kofleriaceae bacterium]
MRSVAFADRLLAPLFSVASQLGGARMFSNYQADGFRERHVASGGWLFPKPWYQDELRWLAAAKMQQATQLSANSMFTTRGTFAPRDAAQGNLEQQVPPELYPYVAPSFVGGNDGSVNYSSNAIDAWSPSVSATATSVARMAAAIGSRTVNAGAASIAGRSPQMSALAASVRAALMNAAPNAAGHAMAITSQSRLAMLAPEMVTPPAPRRAIVPAVNVADGASNNVASLEYREQVAAQRMAVQQRIVLMAAQAQQAQALAAQATAQSAREPAAAAAVAWDSVQVPTVVNERQGQAKSLARQHVELVARPTETASAEAVRSAYTEQMRAAEVAQIRVAQTQTPQKRDSQTQFDTEPSTAQLSVNEQRTNVVPTIAQLTQLVEQLRFAELLAANPGLASFAPASGPRMLMPA